MERRRGCGEAKTWKLDYFSRAKALGRIFLETADTYTETSSCGRGDDGIGNFGLLPHTLLSTLSLQFTLVSVITLERPRQDLLRYSISSMLIKA